MDLKNIDIKNNDKFTHLHVHSHFSILDGLSSPKDLVKYAKEQGFKALALTDHGTVGGLYRFQKECNANGIKPILGMEGYISVDHKVKDKEVEIFHILLLVKNAIGLKNLMKLATIAELEGKYRKPRIDFELLKKHHEGLICTSACPSSELSHLLNANRIDDAKALINKFKDLFGEDYYIEIMKHEYFDGRDQQEVEKRLCIQSYALAKELNVKIIATNDLHYAKPDDWKFHDILLSMQTKNVIKNPKRFTFGSKDFYMKSYDEMIELFKGMEDAVTNTTEIVNKIESTTLLNPSKDLLPSFNLPEGFKTEEDYLKALVKDGMISKGFINNEVYRERIRFEMNVIIKCGYTKYFLILWDVLNYAASASIARGIGRGSATGSLALYVIGVTGVDPIKYDLLFERFLNPDRVSPPDVDIDFDDTRRDEIIEYCKRKYGEDHCCKIGTYQSMKARQVVRYAIKALDLGGDWEVFQKALKTNPSAKLDDSKRSLDLADYIAKTVPEGPNSTIEASYKEVAEFRNAVDKFPGLYETLSHMEKTLSSCGVHASGYVVCKNPIQEHVALRDSKGQICCQFEGPEVEELGLLKFDFLGLKTLTVLDRTVRDIKKRYGKDIDLDKIEPTDKNVLDIFNGKVKGMDNRGIFQFESFGMTKLLKDIHVDSFEDLIVANALYRPGPLGAGIHTLYADFKNHRKPIESLHPKMLEILKGTYGLIVFQESFMKVARELAGFTRGQSDSLRKFVGKKKLEQLAQQRDMFVDGCAKNDIKKDIADKIFDQINYFGGYGFNKCLSGDTLVLNKLDNFYYSLKDLCDYGFGSKYKKPIILDSCVDGSVVDDEVVEVFETGEQEVYKVSLFGGMIIKCTMDHKFCCSDYKKHTLKDIVENKLFILSHSLKSCVAICSVEKIGKQMTYNVTMKSDQHNYKIVDMNGNGVYSQNSHSAAYSLLAYYSAYMKLYYPIEFMCHLLTSVLDDEDKLDEYIKQAVLMNLVILPPNISTSKFEFTIEKVKSKVGKDKGTEIDIIRTPFTALKGVGEKSVANIIANQPYPTMKDFVAKAEANIKVFEVLVDSGAMDVTWGMEREEMKRQYEIVKKNVNKDKEHKKKQEGYMEQFGGGSLFDRIDDTEEIKF